MRPLEIILDVDDTIMRCIGVAAEIVRKKTGYDIRHENVTKWNFMDHPEHIREEMFKVFYSDEFYDLQKPFPGAIEMVQTLRAMGHHVMIFTAVNPHKMTRRAQQILEYFDIDEKDITTGGNKDLMQADIILDDGLHNILTSKCRYPVLMRQPWNMNEKRVLSVNNYDEFIELVKKIANAPTSKDIEATRFGRPGMIALVGPASAGKTAVVDELLKDPRFGLVKAITTRTKKMDDRPNEYHYMSDTQFDYMVMQGQLMEHSTYMGEQYGLAEQDLQPIWDAGRIAIKAMDINGAMEIKRQLGNNVVTVFIRRDKQAVLEALLRKNADVSETAQRIMNLDVEYQYEYRCDWTISNNGDIRDTVQQLLRIIN